MANSEFIQETKEHINNVRRFIQIFKDCLTERAVNHDALKMVPPESIAYERVTGKLKGLTYGSEEYKQALKDLGPALDHHFKNYRHHPEHFENGIQDMNLVDIVEMVCDWKAASMRHGDGDIYKSLDINQERFGFSDELKSIFANTIKLLESIDTINGIENRRP